jgi:hypothetical protein
MRSKAACPNPTLAPAPPADFYSLPKLSQRRKKKNNRDMFSRASPVEVEGKAERLRSAITFDNPTRPNALGAEIFSLYGDRISILPALRLITGAKQ